MNSTMLISSAEEQLKSYGNFLDEYDEKLKKLLKATPGKNNELSKVMREPIVEINYTAEQEQMPLLKLLESDRILNKTLLTFAHICAEIETLKKDALRQQLKFLYIDEDLLAFKVNTLNNSSEQTNEQILFKMSQSIELLCHMQFLVQRCILVGNNLLHQCGAYLATTGEKNDFKFYDIFDCLSELMYHLVTFDEIFLISNYASYWPTYKHTVERLTQNTNNLINVSSSEVSGLQNALMELDYLFTGTIFRSYLDSLFALKDKIGPKGLGNLQLQFNDYLKQQLLEIDKFPQNGDLNDFNETKQIIRLNAFCVVFHDFVGQIESKHVRHLLEINNKHQGIMLCANTPWHPLAFLKKHAVSLLKSHEKLIAPDPKRLQRAFLQQRITTLQRDSRHYSTQIALWTLYVRKALNQGAFDLKVTEFKELANYLLNGLQYAGQISYLVKGVINTHVTLQMPMARTTLLSICKLIEVLKMLQSTFQANIEAIAKIIHCILQYYQYKVLQLLSLCKKKIISSKLHDRNVDSLAAIKIAEKCLSGPPTHIRLLITKIALYASNTAGRILTGEQLEKYKGIMLRMHILSDFQRNLQHVCNTAFIYWHQSILSAYLKQTIERRMDFNTFQYLIKTSDNCTKTLEALNLGKLTIADALKRTNYEKLRSYIISNMCAQIETFLRLEVHSNLQLDKMQPFEQGINDYRDLIDMCPIEINGHYVVLKDHVENYLSAMFYNLTTITLHDWKTYEQMRHLANNRLLLQPVEDYLPNQTLEQGIDILEIMRNIHIFVSKYVYNMNSQIFVEQNSANKHLDTIGIRHVANSLRTHGTGVINTTVNFTYQFLRQKFYTFSQFLFDEQIKSRLMKDLRAFAERKQTDAYPLYPYERADAFNKDIRKLGLAKDGQTYMDLFRKVISHVGNAMGYIRLVRSGSIQANYSASLYLPKFDEDLHFVEMCEQAELSAVTKQAAENVELNIKNLVKSFTDSTDYFKLLVEAFQPFFRNPHNLHLKHFFLIIPPLTLNYVEHMLRVKEKINKKDRQDAVLFDDGFAVGLAYILKLLNQINDFNTLQWFGTVRARFDAERRKIKEMLAEITTQSAKKISKNDTHAFNQKSENEKLQQTLALTERRINAHQQEYHLLYYNLSSAKIFFQ